MDNWSANPAGRIREINAAGQVLLVRQVDAGCACVKLESEDIPAIEPGDSYDIKFVFTPDREGGIMREITLLFNAQNKIAITYIKALSEHKGGDNG